MSIKVTTNIGGIPVTEFVYFTVTRNSIGERETTTTSTYTLFSLPVPTGNSLVESSFTTTNSRGQTILEYTDATRTFVISTILSRAPENKATNDHPGASKNLGSGAIAGLVVGVIVALAILVGLFLLFRRRRHRSKAPPEIAGEESKALEEKAGASRRASRKDDVLPTWKSELSGETHRAELDASQERKLTELDGARSPTEMDSATLGAMERQRAATDEPVDVDATEPPPIPYASKPRPG